MVGEIVFNLCEGLENQMTDYEQIFRFCVKKNLEKLNIPSTVSALALPMIESNLLS